jgi:hypothetical protein
MELTNLEIAIIVCIYLFGVFSCRFATQFFEVSHAAHLVERAVYRCLLMCAKIHEDVSFITEIKHDHLRKGDFTKEQIRDFQKVDKEIIENWKSSVVHSIVTNAPRSFAFVVNFTTWKEAMKRLDDMHQERRGPKE